MKNIFIGILIAFLTFNFVPVFAQQQNQQQQDTQTQIQNQGEDSQIQTQTQTQNENQNKNQNENQTQDQDQTQTQNQGKEQQIQTKQQMEEQAKTVNGETYRNTVSNVVQELLDVADNEKGGIGEQVRVVAQEQKRVQEQVVDQIEAIQKRNKIKTFLIGTSYKNTGALRSEMVQLRNRIEQLNQLMEQTKNQADETALQEQIQTMEEEQTKINSFIEVNESKFSLFGWLVRLFNK